MKKLKAKNQKLKIDKESGLGMVEMIVVLAILVTTFASILQLVFLQRQAQIIAEQDASAYIIGRQTIEAVRSVRDSGWTNISSLTYDTPYYPQINSSSEWELASSDPGSVNEIYTRWVEFGEVFRDANDNIATSGTSDPDTRKVTAYVQWARQGGDTRTITLEAYITNWQEYK
ncbi:MAG: type II secretion system protein [Candidatus Spechtbacterales bacterium]|nr:type II secretion system protein [Candidatus Spechtbacterales bacterium]